MPRQAEVSGNDPFRGRKLGKYEILTRMSVGGMAELFLAFTTGPGGFRKFVALKQILPDVRTDEFVRMFLDEARITAAFSHPNIGQVFDLGEEDGELFLAMEFLPGQNLEQIMTAARHGPPVPVGFSARVVRDVCLGLHYAHHFTAPSGRKVAVVHRDLTPRNVMVSYDGVVKVIDFGIAKAKGRLNRTAVGMVKGTSGYMSPEQVRNQELDGRSDLFCAGVVLHEMLSGQRLYDHVDENAMMRQIAHAEAPPLRSLNPEVPEALEAVVMRALAKDPARRFATGREMARAIEQAMGTALFDEEGVAELMQSLFAEKRQKTLALLNYASHDDERVSQVAGLLQQAEQEPPGVTDPGGHPLLEDGSDIAATLPMAGLSHAPPPARPAAPRPVGGSARVPRKSSASAEPSAPPAKARLSVGRPSQEPPARRPAAPVSEDEDTDVGSPLPPKQARPAPEPDAREGRRPARMGVYTLGLPEPTAPSKFEPPEESEVSEVSRASRALKALEGSSRRGLWILLGIVVLAGIGVLFMPEALRSRVGALFVSAGRWMSEKLSPDPAPQVVPTSPGIPTSVQPAMPPADEYEPPPPGEGRAEPEEAAPAPAPTPPAEPPLPRRAEPAPPSEAAAKPAVTPRKPAQAPAAQARPEAPEPLPAEEAQAVEEPAEPSVGPAEVDPSIQPLEISPPTEPEGEP
jgi:serine/threonine-protein kinase